MYLNVIYVLQCLFVNVFTVTSVFMFTIVDCFHGTVGHPLHFVEHHSMGAPLVLCQYRLHSRSEWSFMRSGAKGFGNVL